MADSALEPDATMPAGAGDAAASPTPVTGRPRVWPLFVTLLLVVLAIMGEAIVLLVLQRWRHPSVDPGAALDARMLEWILVLTEVTLVAAALIAARPFSAPRLGLARGRTTVRLTCAAVIGAVAASYLGTIVVSALGLWKYGRTLPLIAGVVAQSQGSGLARVLFELALLAGLAEELFFRGFMQRRLAERWPRWVGIAVASACFALLHADLVQSPLTLGLGLWFGFVADRSDSIWPAIVAHAANNAVAVAGMSARWPFPLSATAAAAVIILALAAADIHLRGAPAFMAKASADPS